MPKSHLPEWQTRILLYLLIATGLAVFVLAARGDLWLDEIWSLSFAEFASGPFTLYTNFRHDNNHILNTLYIYLVGEQTNFIMYRLLSIAAGGLSLVMLSIIARKWGQLESFLVVILAGISYPLVLYFSEARGYAPALFFSLLAFFLLRNSFERFALYKVLLFWGTVVLGILSHSTFVIVFAALLIHVVHHELRSEASAKIKIIKIVFYSLVPTVFLAIFYFSFLREMIIGGGVVYSKWSIITQAAQLALGFPNGLFFRYLAFFSVMMISLAGVVMLSREHNEEWLFYFAVLFVAPVSLILVMRPVFFQIRYLLVCFPFFYLLLCYLMGKFYRAVSFKGRWFLAAILFLFLLGQSCRLIPLVKFGRGSYLNALLYISKNTSGSQITIGSDNDFRNGMVLHFYSRFLPESKKLRYVEQASLIRFPPKWFLAQSQDLSYKPPLILLKKSGRYRLVGSYPFSGISGWSWYVYRHENKR